VVGFNLSLGSHFWAKFSQSYWLFKIESKEEHTFVQVFL